MSKGAEIKANQSCGGIKSTLERKLVFAESKPHTSSRLHPDDLQGCVDVCCWSLDSLRVIFPFGKHSAQ